MASSSTDLIFWTYVSRSLLAPASVDKDLQAIVSGAYTRNAAYDITGVLIFTGTRFAQSIEGPQAEIVQIRNAIISDDRHTDVTTIGKGRRGKRCFGDWSLALLGTSSHYVSDIIERSLQIAGDVAREGSISLHRLMMELAEQSHSDRTMRSDFLRSVNLPEA